jgi:hypothetical protein
MEFQEFPKMARLSREIIVTEKIDGTNAQIAIRELPDDEVMPTETPIVAVRGRLLIYAGSRSQYLTPVADNFGFAAWVAANADDLASLGPGRHFGEWWGQGIQRKYGQDRKRFSLFNVDRWGETRPVCCDIVPVLYRGMFDEAAIVAALHTLQSGGSVAAPGFMKPEGIVVFHTALNAGFKKTIEKDEVPKGLIK